MREASLRLTEPGFVTECAKRYAALQGEPPGQGELRHPAALAPAPPRRPLLATASHFTTPAGPSHGLLDAPRYPGARCHR